MMSNVRITYLVAELEAEEALELADEATDDTLLPTEDVMLVCLLLKLAISEEREEMEAGLVAVARTELREAPLEPTLLRAEFWELVREAMADEALDWTLLTTEEPLARAELIPEETALAAELALDKLLES